MNPLKLRSERCSPFGKLILRYLEKNPHTNMSQLARQVGISRAGLGWLCLKQGAPDEETAKKIAQIIEVDLTQVARLVHESKLEKLAAQNKLTYATKFSKVGTKQPVPVENAIAGLNIVVRAFHEVIQTIPEEDQPSDFQMYKQAYEIVKGQFLGNRKVSKRQQARSGN
ncbi:winged helix-turn-helix transcriptional regulator [Leptolyngbya sp. NIES-2104]|uniref:winged helix-turn-helix transcriptional regulator n=1 Tax=Leptolyngbya sp. NIES-2104 TaxID=1552121 RepID=UPI00092EF066|nr:winged helix-turn-helix transcriptional regulator [Leptolyngbya sp. NIES-2104]